MEDVLNGFAQEELAAREPRFAAGQLAEEIVPLLEECFFAGVKRSGSGIDLLFPNGQRFRLAIGEVV
ncbi:MAG: hypothetical protein K2L87_05860 [Clostridiales bacterium]|nr:hypothetical protein [Clostridiales bacterium]